MSRVVFLLSTALGTALLIMTLVWVLSVRLRNAGIVDIAWSAMFSVLALLYGLLGSGSLVHRSLGAGMMIIWSLRLASHLWSRVVGHIETEDGRYAKLRASWGASANRRMLFFFLFQGVTNVILSVPILIASMNPADVVRPIEIAGVVLWFIALTGESVADAQLRRFRADPANRGKVCETGLWRYSRHPNYFFEWLIWCAFFLFALGSPMGWVAVVSPVLMLWFLYKVTGIPATEQQSLLSKGDAYRRYQETTSAFVPWPRRKAR